MKTKFEQDEKSLTTPGTSNQPAMGTRISLKGVDKIYSAEHIETVALSNINLDLSAGEFLAVMGPSGSGKSTMLNVLGLLDAPSAGEMFLNGIDVGNLGDRQLSGLRNREIGFIFQSFHLISDLNVLDNVQIPLLYRNVSNRARQEMAKIALKRVGLHARMRHYPTQLSGGQQQRVAIARAIAGAPRLLLAD